MTKEVVFKSEMDLQGEVIEPATPDKLEKIGVKEIEKLPDISPAEQLKVTLSKKQEEARERLAIVFVVGFFIILICAMLLAYFSEGGKVKDISELILAVSGVLSGPLGFIIGYYFKRQEEKASN